MDTKAIASEIVRLRRRLADLEDRTEDGSDLDGERKELHDRLRELQDQMSNPSRRARQDSPAEPDSMHWIPPGG